ncbi:hypothetical protein TSUD_36100 [Trifolium subterraneum]|uniref:Uncharacterized protein n=1 Tax=Trifolium subterraneum TaxID=3900 RepID=A0A2Z6NEY7_TRISU|nr:hypothetical protein TSUD_36100 [Trifolium subterraneum]
MMKRHETVSLYYLITKFATAKKQPRNCVLSPFSWNLANMEISGSKKRKLTCIEEDEEEEAKIETFFALVRSMRETRDRWKNKMSSENVKEENRVVSVWKPMFQLEDFMEDRDVNKCRNRKQNQNPTLDGASTSNDVNCANNKEDDEEKGIDLKLSL